MIGTTEKRAMHEPTGIPIMYFDQLATISRHLSQLKNDLSHERLNGTTAENMDNHMATKIQRISSKLPLPVVKALRQILPKSKITSKNLTRKKLKNGNNWDSWQQSEYKQWQ